MLAACLRHLNFVFSLAAPKHLAARIGSANPRSFDAPIVLDDGSALTTLREAGQYVTKLPTAEQKKPH
jgi:hypothetical protein